MVDLSGIVLPQIEPQLPLAHALIKGAVAHGDYLFFNPA